MVKADLVGQDRLAGSRIPLDDVDPALHEAAAEHGVQAGDAGRYARECVVVGGVSLVHETSAAFSGRVTMNVAPLFGRLEIETEPPIASAS